VQNINSLYSVSALLFTFRTWAPTRASSSIGIGCIFSNPLEMTTSDVKAIVIVYQASHKANSHFLLANTTNRSVFVIVNLN